jgi:hypothetical protein
VKRLPPFAALASLAALVPAQAQAAATCLTEREVAQMAIYAVPSLVDGARAKCSARLASNGFLATRGTAFAAKYLALQDETWPVAKAGILKFVGSKSTAAKGSDPLALVSSLPDQSVRPLVDAMIAQEVGEAIKLENCGNVERGIQLASVMNPRDSGAMIAFVMAMAKPKNAPICPAAS